MRVKVAKIGMELVDKLTGIAYKIEATDESANGEVAKAEATEILDEDDDREPKKVTINADNDRTFRVTKWVEDREIYNASVSNGILVVNGKDVVMGSIVARTILKTFPGVVVFTAAGEEDENLDVVYEYSPSRDRMTRLGKMEPLSRVIENTDTRVVYGFSMTKEIEVKDGDQVTKETVFDRAGLYVLTKGRFVFYALGDESEEYDDDFDDFEDDYEDEDSDIQNASVAEDGFMGYDFTGVVIAQGDKYFYVPKVDKNKDVIYDVFRITNVVTCNGSVEMPAPLTAVTSNNTSARNLGPAIFSGNGFVKIDDNIIRSNELAGYIYLVDAIRENETSTFYLATEDRKIKQVTRKRTADRGVIDTIG